MPPSTPHTTPLLLGWCAGSRERSWNKVFPAFRILVREDFYSETVYLSNSMDWEEVWLCTKARTQGHCYLLWTREVGGAGRVLASYGSYGWKLHKQVWRSLGCLLTHRSGGPCFAQLPFEVPDPMAAAVAAAAAGLHPQAVPHAMVSGAGGCPPCYCASVQLSPDQVWYSTCNGAPSITLCDTLVVQAVDCSMPSHGFPGPALQPHMAGAGMVPPYCDPMHPVGFGGANPLPPGFGGSMQPLPPGFGLGSVEPLPPGFGGGAEPYPPGFCSSAEPLPPGFGSQAWHPHPHRQEEPQQHRHEHGLHHGRGLRP